VRPIGDAGFKDIKSKMLLTLNIVTNNLYQRIRSSGQRKGCMGCFRDKNNFLVKGERSFYPCDSWPDTTA